MPPVASGMTIANLCTTSISDMHAVLKQKEWFLPMMCSWVSMVGWMDEWKIMYGHPSGSEHITLRALRGEL